MTKVTIITVNYNNREGLKTTLESVKNQLYQKFEYIVIDGGSTDGSIRLLEESSNIINYWVSEPDTGVYQAMNKGIRKSTGEYLLFLNSGDHFYSNTALADNLKKIRDTDIVYFNLQVIEDTKKYIKKYPQVLSFSYFVKETLPHPATFIKKEVFKKTEFFKEDFKIVSDWKFFMDAICKFNVSYKYENAVMSTFYLNGMSSNPDNIKTIFNEKQKVLTSSYSAFQQDLEDVLKHKELVATFRKSRIIKLLVKLRFLNRF